MYLDGRPSGKNVPFYQDETMVALLYPLKQTFLSDSFLISQCHSVWNVKMDHFSKASIQIKRILQFSRNEVAISLIIYVGCPTALGDISSSRCFVKRKTKEKLYPRNLFEIIRVIKRSIYSEFTVHTIDVERDGCDYQISCRHRAVSDARR